MGSLEVMIGLKMTIIMMMVDDNDNGDDGDDEDDENDHDNLMGILYKWNASPRMFFFFKLHLVLLLFWR